MKARKFELWMGNFGNGTICANKAVMEHGDYKNVCRISPTGNITWYVKPDYVPGADLLKIERIAEGYEQKARADLDRSFSVNPAGTYYRMLGRLPYEQFSEFTDRFKDEPLEIKYTNLIPLYLKNS